jgi:hypothetical protein
MLFIQSRDHGPLREASDVPGRLSSAQIKRYIKTAYKEEMALVSGIGFLLFVGKPGLMAY